MYYHCIVFFYVRNLVLCLTRELIKFIDYKILLKLQCKTTFNSSFVSKKSSKRTRVDFGIMFFKNDALYEIYSKKLQWPNTFCTSLYLLVCSHIKCVLSLYTSNQGGAICFPPSQIFFTWQIGIFFLQICGNISCFFRTIKNWNKLPENIKQYHNTVT